MFEIGVELASVRCRVPYCSSFVATLLGRHGTWYAASPTRRADGAASASYLGWGLGFEGEG